MTHPSNPSPTNPNPPSSAKPLQLSDLPEDVLLQICHFIPYQTLLSISQTSLVWKAFCVQKVWPSRLAVLLGVRAIRLLPAKAPSAEAWARLLHAATLHKASRTLCISIELSSSDSINALAIQYSISREDIFRTNALFGEHHLASRTHLYVPLLTEDAVLHFTGFPTHQHVPTLVTDNHLSRKYFAVVKTLAATQPAAESVTPRSRRESYVRQLVVKLIAKGLSFHEDEVRFYLDDTNFDVAMAYKQLLADHDFRP